jgi:hypothetical protein
MTRLEVKAAAARIAADLEAEGLPVRDSGEFDAGAKAGFLIQLPDGRAWGFRVPVEQLSRDHVRKLVGAYL